MDYGFLVYWQFRVRPGMEATFERSYGPTGEWAQFRNDPAYFGTELNRDQADLQVYITLDFWASQEAYDNFRTANSVRYHATDAQCEALTESEVKSGGLCRPENVAPVLLPAEGLCHPESTGNNSASPERKSV